MSPVKCAELMRSHPVVQLALPDNEQLAGEKLVEFVAYELQAPAKTVPYTLSAFYGDYITFSIVKHLRHHRVQCVPRYYRWNIRDTIGKLAEVAYVLSMESGTASEAMMTRLLQQVDSGTPIHDHHYDVMFRTFGLLTKHDAPASSGGKKRTIHYTFNESCVQQYLVAYHLVRQCMRKMKDRPHKTFKCVPGVVKETIRRLPATGDVMRIVFGLLNMDARAHYMQGVVLREVISEAKLLAGMSSADVTMLCVEAIYESQNAGDLAQLLDDFTLNQTINYTNVSISAARLAYCLSAVGYLVRTSGHVYGLHISNVGLSADGVAMLADPLNAVSDNSLQVLNLSNNPIGPDGVKRLQRFIVKASMLTHLDMANTAIGNDGVYVLSEYFMCLPLRYLRLSDNDIGDLGLMRMVRNFAYVPTLEWLDVAGNRLTDKSVHVLGEQILSLPNLRSLDLRRNRIGDCGVRAISLNLGKLKHVTSIMLAENCIGERGAASLAGHMWKTKSLRFVNISLNNIPASGVLGLRRAAHSHGSLTVSVNNQSCERRRPTADVSLCSHSALISPDDDDDADDTLLDSSQSVDLLAGREDSMLRLRARGKGAMRKQNRKSWHGVFSEYTSSRSKTNVSVR